MKHLFFFLFLFALNASAQDILVRQGGRAEKVKVLEVTPTEVKYMKSEGATDSIFTKLCSNLFYIRYQDGKLQKFSYDPKRHLYQAGDAIRSSTLYTLGSVGASLASGTCFAIAALSDNEDDRRALFIAGGITAALSLGCWITSIHFNFKSGRELRLSAGEVIYKF